MFIENKFLLLKKKKLIKNAKKNIIIPFNIFFSIIIARKNIILE